MFIKTSSAVRLSHKQFKLFKPLKRLARPFTLRPQMTLGLPLSICFKNYVTLLDHSTIEKMTFSEIYFCSFQ